MMDIINASAIVFSLFVIVTTISEKVFGFILRKMKPQNDQVISKAVICWTENNEIDQILQALIKDYNVVDDPTKNITKQENVIITCMAKLYKFNRELEKGTTIFLKDNQIYYIDPPQKEKDLNIN